MKKKDDFILTLYSSSNTVFSLAEMAQLFPHVPYKNLRDRAHYFTKVGKLQRLRQGMYAKAAYNSLELVNKLYAPSYISLETVLAKGGVVFQFYKTVFAVSYLTRSVRVGDISVQYRQIKPEVLVNLQGIEEKAGYFVASLERAFLDAIYIYKNYHFDNLGALDWEKIQTLKKLYGSRVLEKRVDEYYRIYKEEE